MARLDLSASWVINFDSFLYFAATLTQDTPKQPAEPGALPEIVLAWCAATQRALLWRRQPLQDEDDSRRSLRNGLANALHMANTRAPNVAALFMSLSARGYYDCAWLGRARRFVASTLPFFYRDFRGPVPLGVVVSLGIAPPLNALPPPVQRGARGGSPRASIRLNDVMLRSALDSDQMMTRAKAGAAFFFESLAAPDARVLPAGLVFYDPLHLRRWRLREGADLGGDATRILASTLLVLLGYFTNLRQSVELLSDDRGYEFVREVDHFMCLLPLLYEMAPADEPASDGEIFVGRLPCLSVVSMSRPAVQGP